MVSIKQRVAVLLRRVEPYTRTDMVYLASSGFWLQLQFAVTSILALATSVAFAHLLTKEQFGTYQYIVSLASLFGALTYTGYNTAITRSAAQGHIGTLRRSFRPQLLWNLVPAALALALSGWYAWSGNTLLALAVACVAITLPSINAANSYAAHLAGVQDFKRAALYSITTSVTYYGMLLLGVLIAPQVLFLVVINFAVNSAVTLFFYLRTARRVPVDASADPEAPQHAKEVSLLNALGMIASQLDNVLVFKLLGPAELARYAVAKLIPERGGGIFKLLAFSAVVPRFARQSYSSVRENLLYRSILVFISVMVSAAAYAAIAPLLLRFLYPSYTDVIPYSQVYALTFVMYAGALANSALHAHRKFTVMYRLALALPIIQILAQVVGVLTAGLWGLILARVLAAAIAAAVTLTAALRTTSD